jgi:V/A-type H+-transporting ATPase subunit E
VIYRFSARDVEKNGREIADFIKTLRSEDSFRIEKCDDMVGGVFARSGDGRVEVDYTVNTTIEESRRLVGELISQRLGEGV